MNLGLMLKLDKVEIGRNWQELAGILMKGKYIDFIRDGNAVNVITGHILTFAVLMIITGSIIGFFYLRAEDSSRQTTRLEFTDIGSQIARDITNAYITSEHSSDIDINIKKDIPLTIGGKGYRITLNNMTSENDAYIGILEGDSSNYEIITKINAINSDTNVGGIVYSGSGEINIRVIKNNSGVLIWIR